MQLLGLAPSAAACESQSLPPDLVNAAVPSLSDAGKQELASQVPVTCGPTSLTESPVLDSTLSLPSSLDVTNTASVFPEASESAARAVMQREAGGSGDADSSSLVKGNDTGANTLYQSAGLLHAGGGDDLGMSQVALLSSQTEAQLQELLRQQQWHIRLNQMMQLDVLQQQQQSQAPVVIGADTAASLLWHQQQHVANPTTVSFAFCNDQISQQQQQLLLQQQQQQPQTTVEMKYEVQQQTKPTAEHTQSPRQQKPRLIARGNRTMYRLESTFCSHLTGSDITDLEITVAEPDIGTTVPSFAHSAIPPEYLSLIFNKGLASILLKCHFSGRLLQVDLIKLVSNVRLYVRPSFCSCTKSFFAFNEIWYVGRG